MFVLAPGLGCAALFQGVDSGHGTGPGGVSHHPGLGGGNIPVCPHISLDTRVVPKPLIEVDKVAVWPPISQLPLGVAKAAANPQGKVVINGQVPIVDQDILIPHPTPTQFTTTSTGDKCLVTLPTPAYWCTIGTVAGREAPTGHSRKAIATSKTVFINKGRACRFGDPLGDGTPAFPCLSVITGSSPNVIIGI